MEAITRNELVRRKMPLGQHALASATVLKAAPTTACFPTTRSEFGFRHEFAIRTPQPAIRWLNRTANLVWFVAVFFCLHPIAVTNAAAPADDYLHFRRLTPEVLLPTKQVLQIFEDNRGFLWFGTSDGLARYVPPWWRFWWFRGMAALALLAGAVAMGWAISARRSNARLREAERERQAAWERERAAAALGESEERLRLLGDNLPDSYVYQYTFKPDGTPQFLYLSAGVERLHGVKVSDALRDASVVRRQIAPEQAAAMQAAEATSLQNLTDLTMELRMRRADGQWRWMQVCSRPRRVSERRVLWDGVATDITARKQAEAALRQREEQFRVIMDNLADLVAVLDLDGRRLYNSPSYRILFGDLDSLLGSSSFDQVHPDDREWVRQSFQETVRSGEGRRLEYRMVDDAGQVRHIESQGSVIRDDQGRVSNVLVVARDVTERERTEAALRESERKYRELVEHANSIILRWTRDGRILFLNEFGQRFFGYTEAEICGRHVIGTIVPEIESGGRNLPSLMDEICADPAAFEQNVNENMRRNGEHVWIAWTNKIVLDSQGEMAEILSIGVDMTARKRVEEELRAAQATLEERVLVRTTELAEARDRAEAADRTKSAFLATMSHELRTPLNSIIGFTGILLQGLAGSLNPEQTKQLGMVRNSARHLLALINDVLDISKIEAGQLQVAREPFDLRASITKVVGLVMPLAEKKGLALRLELPTELGQMVSDPRRVEQILLNLLNNAIKFTEMGEVTLKAELVPDINRTPHSALRVAIADTGIGIKPEDLATLFKPFRQVDTGLTRNHEGTGLGLAICRRLADLLGGEIHAESVWQQGSTFTLTLPQQ
jgi:PAS domain S-box-containing protein